MILNCILDCARQRQDSLLDKLWENSCREKVGIWIINVMFICSTRQGVKICALIFFSYTGPKIECPWVEHLQGCQRGGWVFFTKKSAHVMFRSTWCPQSKLSKILPYTENWAKVGRALFQGWAVLCKATVLPCSKNNFYFINRSNCLGVQIKICYACRTNYIFLCWSQ